MSTLKEVLGTIESQYKERQEYAEQQYAREQKQAERTFQFVQEANAEGLKYELPCGRWSTLEPEYEVTDLKDFRIIHRIVGSLERGQMKPVHNTDLRKQLVWQYLTPKAEEYKHISFKYQRKLPRGSRCKVKRVKERTSSYTTVVCES